MRLTRRTLLAMAASTSAIAGCIGGNDGTGSQPTGTDTPPTTTAMDATTEATAAEDGTAGPTVRVSSHPDLGDILVGPDGKTLYMFDSDTNGEKTSTCYESCADAWPPLTVDGEPTKGDAVTAQLAAFERDDGEMQVTAGGWPLYHFRSDEAPGDANGQGINDVWWVLTPGGTPAKPEPETTTSGYTGGY